MNALFALALLASPLRAGVVASVETGVVSPAGPSTTGLPVLAPAQNALGTPSWGGIDLRGALPLLPAPVPGLAGPALNFIGQSAAPEAAPAAAVPSAGARRDAPAPDAAQGRRAEQTPALPAKSSPGANTLAISRDRKRAASIPESAPSLTNSLADENAANPRVEAGRKFFDLGSGQDRGDVSDRVDDAKTLTTGGSSAGGEAGSARGAFADGSSIRSGRGSLSASGGARRSNQGAGSIEDGEVLRDSVASVPGAAAIPAAGGKVAFFRSASPNGDLAASAGSAGAAVLGMPRPLSLDLSGSGLIVRVRSALTSALNAPGFVAEPAAVPSRPGPSTALLERGGMLEAFSVSRVHAESGQSAAVLAAPVSAASRRVLVPAASESSSSPVPSLWWALLALPLFVAAARRVI